MDIYSNININSIKHILIDITIIYVMLIYVNICYDNVFLEIQYKN